MNYELTDIEHDRITDEIATILNQGVESFEEFEKEAEHLSLSEDDLKDYWDDYVASTK